jgi:hypothetical protein
LPVPTGYCYYRALEKPTCCKPFSHPRSTYDPPVAA